MVRLAAPAVVIALLIGLLAALAAAQEGVPLELETQVFEIGRKLRCPACTAESVADSNAQIAIRMRQEIQELLAEGRTETEIIAHFQNIYGDFVLLEPPKRGLLLWVWLLPLAVAALGVGLLVLYLRRWTRAASAPIEASEAELARVREALSDELPPGGTT